MQSDFRPKQRFLLVEGLGLALFMDTHRVHELKGVDKDLNRGALDATKNKV